MKNPAPDLTADDVLRQYAEETLPEPAVELLIRTRYDLARQLLEAREAIRELLRAPRRVSFGEEGQWKRRFRAGSEMTARACLPKE